MKFALAVITLFALAGCASMQPAPSETIATLPVIRVGAPPPQGSEYVVFYPAGFAFPARLKASGSLFASEQQVEARVALTRDLYLYK